MNFATPYHSLVHCVDAYNVVTFLPTPVVGDKQVFYILDIRDKKIVGKFTTKPDARYYAYYSLGLRASEEFEVISHRYLHHIVHHGGFIWI